MEALRKYVITHVFYSVDKVLYSSQAALFSTTTIMMVNHNDNISMPLHFKRSFKV
jgi:hypothetical protein